MSETIELNAPFAKDDLARLKSGDAVSITGVLYTMRRRPARRCLRYLEEHGELPFGLQGQALFYAGPTPATPTRPFGANRSHHGVALGTSRRRRL